MSTTQPTWLNSEESVRVFRPTKLTAIFLVSAAATVLCLSRTALTQNARPRYKLVDLGTFGGPNSSRPGSIESLNPSGAVTGCADTSFLDPDFAIQNPYFSDP